MKTKHSIFNLLTLAFVLLPSILLAQAGTSEYTLLEPLPGIGATANLSTYLSDIFRLTIIFASALAVFQLIRGGFMYITSASFGAKNDAKKIIQETMLGLALVLGSWIIVATIFAGNDKIVKDGFFTIDLNIPAILYKPNENLPTTGGTGGPGPGASTLTQQQVLSQFGNQIGVDGPIKVAGLQQVTINELKRLQSACGCAVIVTSATGGSHNEGTYSHANGYKVDVRSAREGETLSAFIVTNYQKLPDRSDGAKMYRAPNGVLYALESDHWDIQVKQ
jgi:hypothetical protein